MRPAIEVVMDPKPSSAEAASEVVVARAIYCSWRSLAEFD